MATMNNFVALGHYMSDLVSGVGSLAPALPQNVTNGLSTFGTLSAPILPKFLTDNPLPNGFPWGTLDALNSNPYTSAPMTNKTRYYNFTVQRGTIAPDGFNRSVILVNNQFPGPLIEANWGDWFEITLNNHITDEDEGCSIHWHGLLQNETPWYDGIPAIQQCPVPPGGSFTYRFRADLYGSSWYHSHSAQYAGGLYGPMVIYGPNFYPYDVDVGPVLVNDYYQREYFDILKGVVGNDVGFAHTVILTPADIEQPLKVIPPYPQLNVVPFAYNTLVNGKMNLDCAAMGLPFQNCTSGAGLSKFKFQSGKVHRLRLINPSAENIIKVSIDEHTMQVIANDFVPLRKYNTREVVLGVGQRTDVLVNATGNPKGAYWLRVNASCGASFQPNGYAVIYYEDAELNSAPKSMKQPALPDRCFNDELSLTEPLFPIPVAEPDFVQTIDLNFTINATNNLLWIMNNSTFRGNYNHPILLEAHAGNLTSPYEADKNIYNFGTNKTVRIIVRNLTPFPHPMHYHGHNMQVLHVGSEFWDGKSITRPHNPQRRDVQLMPPNGTVVWQFDNVNAGVWPFHCHIAWHTSSGIYTNFLTLPEEIEKRSFPQNVFDVCKAWNNYTSDHVVDQIDSGVKR